MSKSMLYELSEEALSSNNNVRFRIYGQSMKPLIKSGDVVEVSPVDKLSDICAGDIVLFKNEMNRPCLHRVIRIKNDRIFAKGDANNFIDTSLLSNEIMGKLILIERSGHVIRLQNNKLYKIYKFSWIIYRFINYATIATKPFFKFIQSLLLSRHFIRKGLRDLLAKKINVSRASNDEVYDICRLYKCTDPENIKVVYDQIIKKDIYIIAKLRKKIIGVTLLTFAEDENEILWNGWWLTGLHVRNLFRGIGAGQEIINRAIITVKEKGGANLKLLAFKDRKPARRLYEKLGFKPMSTPEIDKILENNAIGIKQKRIYMVKNIF